MKQRKTSKESSVTPPKSLHDWGTRIYKVNYNGFEFYACHQYGTIYVGDENMTYEKPTLKPGVYLYSTSAAPKNYKAEIAVKCSSDQSCAYDKFSPTFNYLTSDGDYGRYANSSEEYYPALEWAYSNYLRLTRGTTCYVTKNDGPVRHMLKALKARGFKHVATNRSNHEGRYNVYLLVHQGDRSKTKEIPDDDSLAVEEF